MAKVTAQEVADQFASGLNCAQITAVHFAARVQKDPEELLLVTSAFGGGFGVGGTCGAISGAMVILGLIHGITNKSQADRAEIMYMKRQKFMQAFAAKHPEHGCTELLNHYMDDLENDPRPCPQLVADAINILEDIL